MSLLFCFPHTLPPCFVCHLSVFRLTGFIIFSCYMLNYWGALCMCFLNHCYLCFNWQLRCKMAPFKLCLMATFFQNWEINQHKKVWMLMWWNAEWKQSKTEERQRRKLQFFPFWENIYSDKVGVACPCVVSVYETRHTHTVRAPLRLFPQ